jgi:hypothetical protein
MSTSIFDQDGFRPAVRDYRFLLDGGYPEKQVQKLVGDRYRLSKDLRMVLYRGVLPPKTARRNAAKRIERRGLDDVVGFRTASGGVEENPAGGPGGGEGAFRLMVDTYNVILTCMNYLLGKAVFIADDGFVRDIGGAHGRITDTEEFRRAAGLVLEYLSGERIPFEMVLDKPVSNSGRHRRIIEEVASVRGVECPTVLSDSADRHILERTRGAAATSDSAVIVGAAVPVFDLAGAVIRGRFSPELFDLRSI